ncbi:phosphoribosyltransferase [Candidatus Bathyarchaeota archaeon]|nr:phosphoribosyltransferase [Candidatus Bathyarchaeota archaeon]
MSDVFECEIMSWALFDKLAKNVAVKIKESGFNPDFMVGLARGGWVLSRVLCDYLGVKDLVSLKVEHWGVTATPDGRAQIKYPFDIDLTGRNVLVVDDITDTGESMIIAEEYVQSMNPASIKTAALRHIEGSKFTPDYYGDVISWRWVVFPWNYVEDMCNIVPKVTEGAGSLDEVKKRLKSRHKIDLSIKQIEEINTELERRKH